MADKPGRAVGVGVKPVPMKLFATWEIEKSSPNCIPRLCTLTLTRLVVMKPLENELASLIIAVKMQNSKRILRSNEIIMPSSGLLDTELDLSFSLQYPHFLKRDHNKLQVMLQRRKKYKNRTILGYKTLAIGQVNMAQVLQRSIDRELNLYSDLKERTNILAQVLMLSLSSQPVDHEENGRQKIPSAEADRSPDVEMSDDDEQPDEDWSNDDMSDSEPIPEVDSRTRARKTSRGKIRPEMSRQRNIKQKVLALLKRFKVSEEVLDSEHDQELGDQDANQQEIEDLFDELEDLSDSGPEMDTISVLSTPKPKLRPFFTGIGSAHDILDVPRSLSIPLDMDFQRNIPWSSGGPRGHSRDSGKLSDDSSKRHDSDCHLDLTDQELSDPQTLDATPPKDSRNTRAKSPSMRGKFFNRDRATSFREGKVTNKKETKIVLDRRHSVGNTEVLVSEPRKVLLEQLGSVLSSDEVLPDNFILVNTNEWQGQLLAQMLQELQHKVICTCSSADVKATISFVVNKIQKFCNSNSKSPSPIKIAIAGGDGYINSVLRPYVEQFSAKYPDWQNYINFLVIPLGANSIAKYLSCIDSTYNSLFMDNTWRDTFDKSDGPRPEMIEIVNRITRYINNAASVVQLPIAEAMIVSTDEESSQIFIPFVNEVRIGPTEVPSCTVSSTSVDLDDSSMAPSSGAALSSSPPQSSAIEKTKDNHTPPSSPNVNNPVGYSYLSALTSPGGNSPPEFMDLQLDYWTAVSKQENPEKEKDKEKIGGKKDNKVSLKTTFKAVQVYRLPQGPGTDISMPNLSMMAITKEKKQKIMRLGKKSKEGESKSQVVEGISRLICTSKSHSNPLTVTIDGVEWMGVKFFQLSPQWQTHVKHFPVATVGHIDTQL